MKIILNVKLFYLDIKIKYLTKKTNKLLNKYKKEYLGL